MTTSDQMTMPDTLLPMPEIRAAESVVHPLQAPEELVAREMVRRLARSELISACTSVLGYGLQAVLLQGQVASALLLAWVLAILAFEAANGVIAWHLLRRVDDTPWRRRLLIALQCTLFGAGAAWGTVVLMPGVRESPGLTMLHALFLAVVGIVSVHNLCFHRGSMFAFGLGLALPLLAAGWHVGIPGALIAGGVALLVILQIYGRTARLLMHQVISGNVANARLARHLRQTNSELTAALHEINRLASIDPLTQCVNRRVLRDEIDRELSRCLRHGSRFGLVMFDLDHFKSINDRFGHGGGDLVLAAAADRLRAQLRATDRLARWGGEEFLCLMTDIDHDVLLAKAEAMRLSLAEAPITLASASVHVTASVGIASFDPGLSAGQLIDLADQAMYRAKQSGRNRVCG